MCHSAVASLSLSPCNGDSSIMVKSQDCQGAWPCQQVLVSTCLQEKARGSEMGTGSQSRPRKEAPLSSISTCPSLRPFRYINDFTTLSSYKLEWGLKLTLWRSSWSSWEGGLIHRLFQHSIVKSFQAARLSLVASYEN